MDNYGLVGIHVVAVVLVPIATLALGWLIGYLHAQSSIQKRMTEYQRQEQRMSQWKDFFKGGQNE
jgi:hypothetical protein